MSKIKIISGDHIENVENRVNKFLEEHPDVATSNVRYQHSISRGEYLTCERYSVMIIYDV